MSTRKTSSKLYMAPMGYSIFCRVCKAWSSASLFLKNGEFAAYKCEKCGTYHE